MSKSMAPGIFKGIGVHPGDNQVAQLDDGGGLRGLAPVALFGCGALLAACVNTTDPSRTDLRGSGSTGADPGARTEEDFVPPQPMPWTDAFQGGAMLLANRIRIVGPPGLLEHFVMRGDDELFERSTKTTEQGLVLTVRPRPGVLDPAKAHLDRWNLNAMVELVATENPGATEVVVTAEGQAILRTTDGASQTGARLTFRGEIQAPEQTETDDGSPSASADDAAAGTGGVPR